MASVCVGEAFAARCARHTPASSARGRAGAAAPAWGRRAARRGARDTATPKAFHAGGSVVEAHAAAEAAAASLDQLQVLLRVGATPQELFALADAAAIDPATAAELDASLAEFAQDPTSQLYSGWLSPVVNKLSFVLEFFQSKFNAAGIPFAEGWSVVALTACVKVITFPFTKQQVESGMAMQNLQPQTAAIKKRWEDDQERQSKELNRLYENNGVNPLAGCIPSLITLPVFWGLYRTLNDAQIKGEFGDPFYWIPSLAGPGDPSLGTKAGISWLYPLDPLTGEPPIGWDTAELYLIVPVLLVASQYATQLLMPAQVDEDDPNAKTSQVLLKVLPLLFGFFALNVPAGLGLYWLSNNFFTTAQTYYLKELGGASPIVATKDQYNVKLGTGYRSSVNQLPEYDPSRVPPPPGEAAAAAAVAAKEAAAVAVGGAAAAAAEGGEYRCKRALNPEDRKRVMREDMKTA